MLRSGIMATVLLTLAGCGGSSGGPVTAPVSGKVTFNGAPLEGAVVNFAVDDFVGSGKTAADGTYSLVTGAAVGENKVWIEKRNTPDGFESDPESGMDAGQAEAATLAMDPDKPDAEPSTLEQIPEDYSDPAKTILKVVVSDGGTDSANFDIKSNE